MPAPRILLLLPTTSYKATDFLAAAERLGAEVVVGTERRQALEAHAPGGTLTIDLGDHERSLVRILAADAERPIEAVVGTDDETVLLAARAAASLGIRHNPPEAVGISRDKHAFRVALAAAGLPSPAFRRVALEADPEVVARELRYPCVIKPLALSASRGVLRADDERAFVAAFRRVAKILGETDVRRKGGDRTAVLVEDYLSGDEVALEGLLVEGELRALALFDKPDPLEGPTFEETMFVTPSRLPAATQEAIVDGVGRAARAVGLVEGPVHAELRLPDGRPVLLEIAARTIGGLCSHALRFGTGLSLEEVVLRHALRLPLELVREAPAAGVLMLPIPGSGTLERVDGVDSARAIEGVDEVTITIPRGGELRPLPEGHRYLGFVVARADSPAAVERALREAQATLEVRLRGSEAGSG